MSGALAPGVWPQLWLGSPAFSYSALAHQLDAYKALGLPGVALHAGPRKMAAAWPMFSGLVTGRGMKCLAAFGLDGHDDIDGTVLTATEKAACMAGIATESACAGIVQDAEGAYDTGEASTDRAIDAETLGREFRRLAPAAYVTHQPWFKPTVHWRFPYEIFAIEADEVSPQVYCNDFIGSLGHARYRVIFDEYERAWKTLELQRLARIGQLDARFPTIQSYAWDDIVPDLVDCLLHHPRCLAWSQPFPPPLFLAAIRFVRVLEAHGFYDAARPETFDGAVIAFQRDYNRTAARPIAADNRAGRETLAAAGIAV